MKPRLCSWLTSLLPWFEVGGDFAMVVVMLTVELFIDALKAEDDDEDSAQRCVLT